MDDTSEHVPNRQIMPDTCSAIREQKRSPMPASLLSWTSSGSSPPRLTDDPIRDRAAVPLAVVRLLLQA